MKLDYSVNQKRNSYFIGVSYMTMNNEFYKIMSEEISARVDAGGDRLMLRDPALDSDRQKDRVQGFIDTVSGQSGIEIVEKVECEGQLEIAMPKLQEKIDSGLVFDNIFCLNDLASVGVVAALDENQMLYRSC